MSIFKVIILNSVYVFLFNLEIGWFLCLSNFFGNDLKDKVIVF